MTRTGQVPVIAVLVAVAAPVAIAVMVAMPSSHHPGHATTGSAVAAEVPPASGAVADGFRHAAGTMEAVASYRFAGEVRTGAEKIGITGEFSAPDRLDETFMVTGAPPVERIVIGTVTYQRAGAIWRAASGSGPTMDPRTTFAALAQATTVTAQASGYAFELTGNAARALIDGPSTAPITGTVDTQAGLITEIAYRSSDGSGTAVQFSYSEIGAAPPVTAPKTGA